jgi:hypothetical protein
MYFFPSTIDIVAMTLLANLKAQQKSKNGMSGNEFAREKERVAAIMQEKQKKGK